MTVPHAYFTALLLTVLTMLCWGSWANVVKIVGNWRFELLYFDYAFGILLASVVAGLTFGSMGGDGLPFLDDLETALSRDDRSKATGVAARIAGLGPGLTPSGDDLLAGALGFHAWAEAAGHAGTGGPMRAAISDAAVPRTTRLAGQLLRAAAGGHVAAPVVALLSSIFRRDRAFPPDLAPVLAIGETSGADMLAGIRLAGRAQLQRRRLEGALA